MRRAAGSLVLLAALIGGCKSLQRKPAADAPAPGYKSSLLPATENGNAIKTEAQAAKPLAPPSAPAKTEPKDATPPAPLPNRLPPAVNDLEQKKFELPAYRPDEDASHPGRAAPTFLPGGPQVKSNNAAPRANEAKEARISVPASVLSQTQPKKLVEEADSRTDGSAEGASYAMPTAWPKAPPLPSAAATAARTEDKTAAVPSAESRPSAGPRLADWKEDTSGEAAGSDESADGAGRGQAKVQLCNTKLIVINYEVRDGGDGDVSGVELWYTQDQKTWHKAKLGSLHRSPYVVEVAEEGLYGFTAVARTGKSDGQQAPQPGDVPQMWAEVDLTSPAVHLLGTELSGGERQELTVYWKAADKNMGPKPVTLSYAEKASGPWIKAASGLENTGRYVWRLPSHLPPRIYVRVEATDQVGNSSADVTTRPVLVGSAQPTAAITAIQASSKPARPQPRKLPPPLARELIPAVDRRPQPGDVREGLAAPEPPPLKPSAPSKDALPSKLGGIIEDSGQTGAVSSKDEAKN